MSVPGVGNGIREAATLVRNEDARFIDTVVDSNGHLRLRVEALIAGGVTAGPTTPLVTNLANTTAPLGPGGVFVSPVVQIDSNTVGSMGSNILDLIALLSGGGTLVIEVSKDGVTFFTQNSVALSPGVPGFVSGLRLAGIFARLRLIDGGAGSATVLLHADIRGI